MTHDNGFLAKPRTYKAVVRHINYTCDPEEHMARQAKISIKELLRQMVDYALDNRTDLR